MGRSLLFALWYSAKNIMKKSIPPMVRKNTSGMNRPSIAKVMQIGRKCPTAKIVVSSRVSSLPPKIPMANKAINEASEMMVSIV